MTPEQVPPSDEVAANLYRLAQANRMIRFAEDSTDAPTYDDQGKVVPEAEDFQAVKRQRGEQSARLTRGSLTAHVVLGPVVRRGGGRDGRDGRETEDARSTEATGGEG